VSDTVDSTYPIGSSGLGWSNGGRPYVFDGAKQARSVSSMSPFQQQLPEVHMLSTRRVQQNIRSPHFGRSYGRIVVAR
jgi:hypothetical protein